MKETTKLYIGLRVPESTKNKLVKLASEKGLTLATYLRIKINKELNDKQK